MERTEKRVEKDLLGAGPKSVEELRAARVRLKQRYKTQLQRVKERAEQQQEEAAAAATAADESNVAEGTTGSNEPNPGVGPASMESPRAIPGLGNIKIDQVKARASNVATGATTMAAGVFAKIKSPSFNPLRKADGEQSPAPGDQPTTPQKAPPADEDLMTFSPASDEDGDWVQSPMQPPTDAIENFTIDDDDELL